MSWTEAMYNMGADAFHEPCANLDYVEPTPEEEEANKLIGWIERNKEKLKTATPEQAIGIKSRIEELKGQFYKLMGFPFSYMENPEI